MHWLKQRREDLNLSQRDLAEQLAQKGFRITPGTISHWENERHNLPLLEADFREALAEILRLDSPTLMKLAGHEMTPTNRSREAEKAAHIVEHLPDDKKDLALRILAELAKEFSS